MVSRGAGHRDFLINNSLQLPNVLQKRTLFTQLHTRPTVKERPIRIVYTNGASTNVWMSIPGKRNTFKCETDLFSKVTQARYKELPTESPWEYLERTRAQTRREKDYEARKLADEKGTAARAAELERQLAEQEASETQKEETKKENTRAQREKAKKQKEEERREAKEAAKKSTFRK